MESRFTIFVLCVTMVQNTLASRPSITSTGIQAGCELDLAILQGYKTIAVLQTEKTIQSLSFIEHEAYLARAGGRDNLYMTETCKDELVYSLFAAFKATLAPILVLNPEAALTLATIQTAGKRRTVELAKSLCSAIIMATTENHSGVEAETQAKADVHISGAATFNAAYFEAFLNGDVIPKKLAFQNAKNKATSELMSGIEDIFLAIKALIPSGTQAHGEDVFSAIETMNKRASSRLTADINVKLGFLQELLTDSCMMEHGTVISSCAIQNDRTTKVSVENESDDQSEMVSENCNSKDPREKTDFEAVKGMQLFFTTIENELAKISLKTKRVPKNDDLETAKATAVATYNEIVDIIMDAILLINPDFTAAIETARLATKSEVKKEVACIYDGLITWISERNSPKILSKIQALQDEAIYASLAASKHILHTLLLGETLAKVRAKIEHDHKETMSQLKNEWHAIFDGLRIRMSKMSSGTRVERHNSILTFEVSHTKGPVALKAVVRIIFDGIQARYKASVKDQVERTTNWHVIQSHRQKAMIKVKEAVNLVFNDIMAFTEVSPVDENIPEDNLDNIRTGNAGTNAAWKAGIEIVFRQIPSRHSAASLELKNAAITQLENAVNITYMSIATALNGNSPKTLTELHSMENTTARGLIKVTKDIFAEIQGYVYDAEVNATLNGMMENTILNNKNSTRNVFAAVETLMAATSSEIEAGNKNYSSIIAVFLKKAIANTHYWVENVFDSIELLRPKMELPDGTCRVRI